MPDPQAITNEHVDCLAELLQYPTRYVQRCTDQLAFLPTGGHRWTKNVQICLPENLPGGGFCVVSLGMFRRRRLADLEVRDALNRRLNLLTRKQHGSILCHALLAIYFRPLSSQMSSLEQSDADSPERRVFDELVGRTYAMFTTVGDVEDPTSVAKHIGELYLELWALLGANVSESAEPVSTLVSDLVDLQGVTQYLCWAPTDDGPVLNLTITYTTADTLRPLDGDADADGAGPRPGAAQAAGSRPIARMGFFRRYGLAPLNYAFSIPGDGHVGSYYFTMEPPPNTAVSFFDWETGNSIENAGDEVDSALPAVHLHNDSGQAGGPESRSSGRTIRAYLRSDQREHKKIAAGALLNAVFVFLVASGRFSGIVSGTAQVWLLVTPTVLTAYLAEQQRHYYSHATRRQRAVLWIYLAIGVLFLITTSFSLVQGESVGEGWGWRATSTAWLLAVSSAFIFAWYAPLGFWYQRTTKKWFKAGRKRQSPAEPEPAHRSYEAAILRYCDWILRGVAFAVIAMLVTLIAIWPHEQPPAASADQGEKPAHGAEQATRNGNAPAPSRIHAASDRAPQSARPRAARSPRESPEPPR